MTLAPFNCQTRQSEWSFRVAHEQLVGSPLQVAELCARRRPAYLLGRLQGAADALAPIYLGGKGRARARLHAGWSIRRRSIHSHSNKSLRLFPGTPSVPIWPGLVSHGIAIGTVSCQAAMPFNANPPPRAGQFAKAAAFQVEADRLAADLWPMPHHQVYHPCLQQDGRSCVLCRTYLLFSPQPSSLLTVAQARRSASFPGTHLGFRSFPRCDRLCVPACRCVSICRRVACVVVLPRYGKLIGHATGSVWARPAS